MHLVKRRYCCQCQLLWAYLSTVTFEQIACVTAVEPVRIEWYHWPKSQPVTVTRPSEQISAVFLRESAYGGRFTLSASSCGSIKALAEWLCGHLLWTKRQRAELSSANICNVCLDLNLHARDANNKHSAAQSWERLQGPSNLCSADTHLWPHVGLRAVCKQAPFPKTELLGRYADGIHDRSNTELSAWFQI